MSKDQKSMGRRNVICTASSVTALPAPPSHSECLSTATKVAFVCPLGDVTQA